ncbi:MAG: AAA family ATPase [Candidatus Omnitrophica bacterium]|nr:AAA family ATPase [Candidatus Omnitrophota bacterium]
MILKSTFREPLEFNERFVFTIDLLENTSQNALITGKAGTGKSTLLKYFREHTLKNAVVLAPTGVAAVNIQGQTIHSFFCLRPDTTPESVYDIRLRKAQKELYKNLETIVIDEISMVRADLLDCVDNFLRAFGKNPDLPFGGVQMVFIGDLLQLPPVVSSPEESIFKSSYKSAYFFDSKVFQDLIKEKKINFIELDKIYRQKDDDFIQLLAHIREGKLSGEDMNLINSRVARDFVPPDNDFFIYLTTTNRLADEVNEKELSKLIGPKRRFSAEVSGKFDPKSYPTKEDLELKVGAQVMMLNNDPESRWVNGTVGRVIRIADEEDKVVVELEDGRIVDVNPHQWDMYRFYYDEELDRLQSESVGLFKQYPLRLAWAVTIHKSQGKTFSKVIVDVGWGAFACGQIYVALSRCTHFEGIILKRPIAKKDILIDAHVLRFVEEIIKITNIE